MVHLTTEESLHANSNVQNLFDTAKAATSGHLESPCTVADWLPGRDAAMRRITAEPWVANCPSLDYKSVTPPSGLPNPPCANLTKIVRCSSQSRKMLSWTRTGH